MFTAMSVHGAIEVEQHRPSIRVIATDYSVNAFFFII